MENLQIDSRLFYAALALLWLIARVWRVHQHGQGNLGREISVNLLFLFFCYLYWETFDPFIFRFDRVGPPPNLVPVARSLQMFRNALATDHFLTRLAVGVNLLGNFLIFSPIGFLLALLSRRLRPAWRLALTGFGISLSIELMQLLFRVRVFDVDDLILNTLGTLFGLGLFQLMRLNRRFRAWSEGVAEAELPNSLGFSAAFAVAAAASFFALFLWQYLKASGI